MLSIPSEQSLFPLFQSLRIDHALLSSYLMFCSKINERRGREEDEEVKEGRSNHEQLDLVTRLYDT